MALNPDDLLIFKTREEKEKEEKEKEKKSKKGEEEQTKPSVNAPQQAPTQAAQEKTEANKVEVSFKPTPSEVEEKPANEEAQFKAERETKNIGGNELVFYKVAPVESAEELVSGPSGNETQLTSPEIKKILQRKHLSGKESRRIGEHMTCTWHPWRQAYAICDYCRRPFCYEDLVEKDGLYYCLDDIDKVTNIREAELSKYNSFRVVASSALFLIFAIFLYYNYNMIATLPTRLQSMGLNNYFENIFNPITVQIIEVFLVVFGLIVSLAVAADIKKSLQLTLVSGIASMLFFGYEYIKTSELYLGLIALLSFIAVVAIIYSKTSYTSLHVSSEEDLAAEVLNASKTTF